MLSKYFLILILCFHIMKFARGGGSICKSMMMHNKNKLWYCIYPLNSFLVSSIVMIHLLQSLKNSYFEYLWITVVKVACSANSTHYSLHFLVNYYAVSAHFLCIIIESHTVKGHDLTRFELKLSFIFYNV